MKIHHFASAAAAVLVLASAAPAFADPAGFVNVWGGSNRNHPTLSNNEEFGVSGAFAIPVGDFMFQGEAAYVDTGRDAQTLTSTTHAGDTSFDVQTVLSASIFKRDDKKAFGATVSGGELG